jgi:hypothetical protein
MQDSSPVRNSSERDRVLSRSQFTVLDELVLIIPLAAAIVVARAFLTYEYPLGPHRSQDLVWRALDWVSIVLLGLAPRFAAMGMVALLILRLRRPRPSWRKLARQPGTVACAAATAALLTGTVFVLARYVSAINPIGSNPFSSIPTHMPNDLAWGTHDWPIIEARIPQAVVSAWVTLALCGTARAEPSWIDRTGRVFGSYWVGLWMFRWCLALWS